MPSLSSSTSDSMASTSSSASGFFPSISPISSPTNTSTAETRGSGGGQSQSGNPAASASLYLYTFLATLVLLLSVSAAIILRSLLLRRRHRRMVEEAIRNGTWVPPSPGGSGTFPFGGNGRRIDLSKKPRMWEAFVGGSSREHHYVRAMGKAEAVTEWEWDSIRPFAAAYVDPPNTNNDATAPAVSDSTTPAVQPSLSDRVKSLFDRSRRTPSAAAAAPTDNLITATGTTIATPATTAPLLDGSALPPTTAPVDIDPPQKVRVAVLIAMPHPPESSLKSRSPTPTDSDTPVASTSASARVIPPNPHSLIDDEEPDLPHIEFGVAELDVSVPHPPSSSTRAKDVRSSVVSASGSSID